MTDYQNYINALRKCAKEHDNDTTYTGHIIVSDLCRDTANLLEALEQEPKTGHWIEQGDEYIEVYDISGKHTYAAEYKCNICGFIHTCIEDVGLYNFCPNCGAEMKEGDA